jgi:hypothetical protein
MKLVIKRSQADVKGMLGGHKGVQFNLHYRLVLDQAEAAVVDRYKLSFHVLSRSNAGVTRTVADAMGGITQSVQSVEVLLNNERVIKEACDEFYTLLRVAQSFGGEEVVDFPLPGSA